MKIGDKVVIIHSPYKSVKNGTIAYIIDIKFIDYGSKWELYILDNPQTCHSFRSWEIRKVEDEKE